MKTTVWERELSVDFYMSKTERNEDLDQVNDSLTPNTSSCAPSQTISLNMMCIARSQRNSHKSPAILRACYGAGMAFVSKVPSLEMT